jgi:hypothetical protein
MSEESEASPPAAAAAPGCIGVVSSLQRLLAKVLKAASRQCSGGIFGGVDSSVRWRLFDMWVVFLTAARL